MTRLRLAFGFAVAFATACSFDWGVRSSSVTSTDAGEDAPIFHPGDDSGPLIPDAGSDVGPGQCASLEAKERKAKADAELCPGGVDPTACKTTVKDACGCDFAPRDPASAETQNYVQARDAFTASCGTPVDCPSACPTLTAANSRGCFPVEGGAFYACFQ